MKKTYQIIGPALAALFIMLKCSAVSSVPMDLRAAKEVVALSELMQKPLEGRTLSKEQSDKYVSMTQANNGDQRLIAVLALAFDANPTSLAVLQQQANSEAMNIAGAANYALTVRAGAGQDSSKLFGLLCYRLGRSKKPWERMFIANRLAVDFGDKAETVILNAAKEEGELEKAEPTSGAIARTDMLYYLSQTKDASVAKEILGWEVKGGWMPESIASLMGAITPGRPRDDGSNSWGILSKRLKKRFEF